MKNLHSLILLLLLTMLLSFGSVFSQVLTLEDAVNTALANNEKIKQYVSRVEQKEYQNLAAWGNFLPKLTLDGSFTHLNDPLNIDLSGFKDVIVGLQAANGVEITNIYNILQAGVPLSDQQKLALRGQIAATYDQMIPSFNMNLKKQDYWTASFTGVMPLFYGGKLIAAKKYASLEEESASIELEKTRQDIAADVARTYLGVILLNDVVALREEVLETIGKHRDEAARLFEEGIIPKFDLLRAEVAYSEASRNLYDDKNNLKLAITALKNQMGVDYGNEYLISDTLHLPSTFENLDYYLKFAELNQPIFKLLEAKKSSADQKYNVELSNFLPKIGAFGKYELYPEYLSALEPRWAVGVKASFSIFNGFQDYLNLQAASKLEEEVDHIEAQTRKDITLYIRKVFMAMQNAENKFTSLESDIILAKESLHHAEKRFDTGMGTMLEVTDAQVSYEAALIDRAKAKYEFYTNLNQLYLICGSPAKFIEIWNLTGVNENE